MCLVVKWKPYLLSLRAALLLYTPQNAQCAPFTPLAHKAWPSIFWRLPVQQAAATTERQHLECRPQVRQCGAPDSIQNIWISLLMTEIIIITVLLIGHGTRRPLLTTKQLAIFTPELTIGRLTLLNRNRKTRSLQLLSFCVPWICQHLRMQRVGERVLPHV